MAQKDKVKELVGRGLDSYHTKALQQIDRIEKKNKEQNHKINILTNELDNDYLTKTEEGSVISLEHSKEGMVYLDELQGNTLVNYCPDGANELTLNGDIEEQGTNITLTEGVDNGLVDVICEGNTLVNLVKNTSGSNLTLSYPLTIGKQYTVVIELESNMDCHFIIEEPTSWCAILDEQKVKQGFNKFIVLSRAVSSNYTGLYRLNLVNRLNGSWSPEPDFTNIKCSIIEGDYTNSVDEVFEGMKSVGECEDNKVEILSRNSDNTLLNTKEITLQEPLRGLPNGVRDRIVVKDGKLMIERNCAEITPSGDEVWTCWYGNSLLDSEYLSFYMSFEGMNYKPNKDYALISDILIDSNNTLWDKDLKSNSVALNADTIISLQIGVKKSELQIQDVNGFKQWLKTNKPRITYLLATPIYEELPIDLTLNTYNDITHISTNSTIPCNMVVKNTGYNTIIKPSTQYTVAFDTNKTGEVGINLGGSKVTTTNNVATVTTPSTLTDDTLRLTGKGVTASRVRLLEGDKTNWIPSYFEG
ncbi:MAG: hypothetical protein J6D12_04025, partial [Peptostreptococcaceae bacterium]|nr:hypothetical protein [Peptostreptococcaceae bacterium]